MSSLFATGPRTTHSVSKFAWSQSYWCSSSTIVVGNKVLSTPMSISGLYTLIQILRISFFLGLHIACIHRLEMSHTLWEYPSQLLLFFNLLVVVIVVSEVVLVYDRCKSKSNALSLPPTIRFSPPPIAAWTLEYSIQEEKYARLLSSTSSQIIGWIRHAKNSKRGCRDSSFLR